MLILAQVTLGNGLSLTKLATNEGLAAVKLGTAMMKKGQWEIIKTIDLQFLYEQLEYNIETYTNLSALASNNSNTRREVIGLEKQVDFIMKLVEDRFNQIIF